MQVTFTNPSNGRKWRVRPYSNGLCLLVERSSLNKTNPKNGKEIKNEFTSCDKYPDNWAAAVALVLKLMLNDTEDTEKFEIDEPNKIAQEMASIIRKKMDDILVEVEK